MIVIDIEKKLRTYKGSEVLLVNATITPGTVTKIYGPSGAGKTTLLKVIAGLAIPESGVITVNNETWLDTANGISLSPQKRKCGFVFQEYALFPNMTVLQHLEYATNDLEWIKKLLKLGKLETFASHKPEFLSGGQQQRLAILRALAIKPLLLLMDEPFSALDPEMRMLLITELRPLLSWLKTTTFIVTHNPQELEGWFDQEILVGSQDAAK